MKPSISVLEISKVVKPDTTIFLRIAASFVNAVAVNATGFKTILANGFSTFPIKASPVFNNNSKSLPKNPPVCTILCNLLFDNFILDEKLFAEGLRGLETYVLVNNKLWGKLFLSLESPMMKDLKLFWFFYCRFQLVKLQMRQY